MSDVNKLKTHAAGLLGAQFAQQFYFWKHCLELNLQKQLEPGFLVGLYETREGAWRGDPREGIWHEIIRRVLSDRHDFHAHDLFQGMSDERRLGEYSAARIAENLWSLWSAVLSLDRDAAGPKVEEFVAACLLVWTSNNAWEGLKTWAQKASTKFQSDFGHRLAADLWIDSADFGRRHPSLQWPGDGEFETPTEVSFWLALHAVEVAYVKLDHIRHGTATLGEFSLPPARAEHMPGVVSGLGKLLRHMAACAPAWQELLELLFAFKFRDRDAAAPLAPITAEHGQDLIISLAGTRSVGKTTVLAALHRLGKGHLENMADPSTDADVGPGTLLSFSTELQVPQHGNPKVRCADVAGEDLITSSQKPNPSLGAALTNRPPAAFLIVLDPTGAVEQQGLALAQMNQWVLNNAEPGKFSIPIVILINKIDEWKKGKPRWIDLAKRTAGLAPEFFGGSFAQMDLDKALSEQPGHRDVLTEAVTHFGPELEKLLANNPHVRVYFSEAIAVDCQSLHEAWSYLASAVVESSKIERLAWKAKQITHLTHQVEYFKLLHSLGSYLSEFDQTFSSQPAATVADLATGIGWLLHGLNDLVPDPEPGKARDNARVETCKSALAQHSQNSYPGLLCSHPGWSMNSLLDHLLEDLGINHGEKDKVISKQGETGEFTSDGGEIAEADAWKPLKGSSRTRCAFVDNYNMFAASDIPENWPAGKPSKNLLTDDFTDFSKLKTRIGYLVNQRSSSDYRNMRLPQFALKKGSTDLARIESLKTVFPKDKRAEWVAELLVKMKKLATPVGNLRGDRLVAAQCLIRAGATAHEHNSLVRVAASVLLPGSLNHALCELGLNNEELQYLRKPSPTSDYAQNRNLFGEELRRYSARMCRHLARVEAEYYKRTKWLHAADWVQPQAVGLSHFPDTAVDVPLEHSLAALETGFKHGGILRPGLLALLKEKLNV